MGQIKPRKFVSTTLPLSLLLIEPFVGRRTWSRAVREFWVLNRLQPLRIKA